LTGTVVEGEVAYFKFEKFGPRPTNYYELSLLELRMAFHAVKTQWNLSNLGKSVNKSLKMSLVVPSRLDTSPATAAAAKADAPSRA
jgi:hypothetical protein